MRDAARALDDVSDHLGEVLRHADALLAEWSRFGTLVQTQVEREVGAIGEVVDGAVARAASAGLDRAIADRLSALTTEITKLEARARSASRAVAEQRAGDRRMLWAVVAGVVLANVLLVAIWLRKPAAPVLPEAVRVEAVLPVVVDAGTSLDAVVATDASVAADAAKPDAGKAPEAAKAGAKAPEAAKHVPPLPHKP